MGHDLATIYIHLSETNILDLWGDLEILANFKKRVIVMIGVIQSAEVVHQKPSKSSTYITQSHVTVDFLCETISAHKRLHTLDFTPS